MTTQLRGTMLEPGVSANRRLYTPELIQKAFEKLTERLKDGSRPVTMLTHHEAGDNSVKIAGRVTGVMLEDGKLNYTAELAPNSAGQDIAALVDHKDGEQFLRGVSIRGWWVGDPTTKTYEGQMVTTADDMEIDGLDFTKTPGVAGAFVVPVSSSATESDDAPRTLITESVETRAEIREAANPKPYGSVRYADPGYQSDKVKRYPIDTKAHAKAAWSYINQPDNQKSYTPAQLKRIRARIKGALQKFGVNVSTESTEIPAPLTEAATTLSEYYCVTSDSGQAGFCISAYNGPLTVTVSAYSGVEPEDLSDVAAAAMKAACDAIHALDPDDDGDIDTGASEQQPDDNQMETAPASETVKESEMDETTETAPVAETTATTDETTTDETTVASETTVDESAPLTLSDLKAAVAEAVAAALAPREAAATAPEGEVTETVEEAAPTDDELRESIRAEVIKEALEKGIITRRGLVESSDAAPAKPLHEMNEDEFRAEQQRLSGLFFSHNQ
jgi:hypothetical protein